MYLDINIHNNIFFATFATFLLADISIQNIYVRYYFSFKYSRKIKLKQKKTDFKKLFSYLKLHIFKNVIFQNFSIL